MEAYIISISQGKVLIGDKIFQPNIGKVESASGHENLHKYPKMDADAPTLEEAKRLLTDYLKSS
jgi:hypothetical protein